MNKKYMSVAQDLAKYAGKAMLKHYGLGMKKQWKEDGGKPSMFLTKADTEINELAIKTIRKHFPEHSILAEEGDHKIEGAKYVWICDPIDGTHNFCHGLPTFSFGLALLEDGQPIIAVVLDPFQKRMFTAQKGKGAYLNNKRIKVNKHGVLKKAIIGAGKTKQLRNFFPFMDEAYGQGVSFITGLSIHYMAALVAAGEFSAVLFGGKSTHDMAPWKLLIEEAGGTVTDIWGNPTGRYDSSDVPGQIGSNGKIHDAVLAILEAASPKK